MGIIIKNAFIVTCDGGKVISDGFIKIDGGKIAQVGGGVLDPPANRPAGRRLRGDENPEAINHQPSTINSILDARGRIVMPGLINPHMHLYSQFARGMAVPPMKNFVEILKNLWWRLDNVLTKEDVYFSGLLGLIEAVKSGVTTVIDHHASYGATRGSLAQLAKTFTETGIRGVLCYEVSDRNGESARTEAIGENVQFLDSLRKNNGMLAGMFGLHASFTLSRETLDRVRGANKTGAPYHIHVAEGPEDAADAVKKYKRSVVARLNDEGILTSGTIAAHCIHINDADIQLLKKSGAFVVHNPLSNMNNAVGRTPYLELCKAGVNVGIGTDGMSAGIFQDVRATAVIHKESAHDPQAGWCEVQKSALSINPAIASQVLGRELGVIKVGAPADIVITDTTPFTEVTAENYWGHILFSVAVGRMHTTIADGKILMQEYELKGIDEMAIVREARKLSKKLWKRFK